jgi:hypothetical protein
LVSSFTVCTEQAKATQILTGKRGWSECDMRRVLSPEQVPKPAKLPTFDAAGVRVGDALSKVIKQIDIGHNSGEFAGLLGRKEIAVDGVGSVTYHYWFDEIGPEPNRNDKSKVVGITLDFRPDSFDTLVTAFTQKLGTPPYKQGTNERGNEIAMWATSDGDFTLQKYGSYNSNEGWGRLDTPEFENYFRKEESKRQSELREKM